MIDSAKEIVDKQKQAVDPIYHEKIDRMFARYCVKLAANLNKGFAIEARVPSIMIAGPANFPVRKKEQQNAARRHNAEEYQNIQGILDKIQGVGMGGISSDDPNAMSKLKEKLETLQNKQETMKAVNAYFRKHGTLEGISIISEDVKLKIEARTSNVQLGLLAPPYAAWTLSNNNAEIKRIEGRIKAMERLAESSVSGWTFDGGEVVINKKVNRVQILFDGKPDEAVRAELKRNGFKWAPSQGAWQRQLTSNAMLATKRIKSIVPIQKSDEVTKIADTEVQANGYTSVREAISQDKVNSSDTPRKTQDTQLKNKYSQSEL